MDTKSLSAGEDELASMRPRYKSATVLERELWNGVTLELFGDIESVGLVRYRYVLAASGPGGSPACWVCAERSRLLLSGASQGFFLGLFARGGHVNLGPSRDWSDRRLFLLKAMGLVRQEFARPLKLWPVTRVEKTALNEVWTEMQAKGGRPRLRSYIKAYDAALPPMVSRAPQAAG